MTIRIPVICKLDRESEIEINHDIQAQILAPVMERIESIRTSTDTLLIEMGKRIDAMETAQKVTAIGQKADALDYELMQRHDKRIAALEAHSHMHSGYSSVLTTTDEPAPVADKPLPYDSRIVVTNPSAYDGVAVAKALDDERAKIQAAMCGPVAADKPAPPTFGQVMQDKLDADKMFAKDQPAGDDAAVGKVASLIYKWTGVMGTRTSDDCQSTQECAHATLAAIRSDPWAFLDKDALTGYYLADLRAKLAKMEARVMRGEHSDNCPFCSLVPSTGHSVPMCPLCRMEADKDAETTKDAELSALRARLAEAEKIIRLRNDMVHEMEETELAQGRLTEAQQTRISELGRERDDYHNKACQIADERDRRKDERDKALAELAKMNDAHDQDKATIDRLKAELAAMTERAEALSHNVTAACVEREERRANLAASEQKAQDNMRVNHGNHAGKKRALEVFLMTRELVPVELWEHKLGKAEKERDAARAEAAKLQAFKDFVHRRLDEMGVEKEPNGAHSAEGCRVGDRLDIVAQWKERAEHVEKVCRDVGWRAGHLQDFLNYWKERAEKAEATIRGYESALANAPKLPDTELELARERDAARAEADALRTALRELWYMRVPTGMKLEEMLVEIGQQAMWQRIFPLVEPKHAAGVVVE